ncbi:MAG: hypothetical protein ACTSUN_08950 [Promethearchaeota archaeon]
MAKTEIIPKTISDTNPINHRGFFTGFLKNEAHSSEFFGSPFITIFCYKDPKLKLKPAKMA